MDDNRHLHACLKRDIKYYGQLKSFLNYQGEIEGLDETTLTVINSKVELLSSFQELYQTGRAKPIDRAVLQDSGCVSDVFIDVVDAKLKEVDHNPQLLIEALRAREVSGFMRAKIDELEDYLFKFNYLDGNEVLTPEEIDIQIHALLTRMELSADEAEQFLKRVMC
jgi:hypothetical protein